MLETLQFENLKELKYGDEIIMEDPLVKGDPRPPYVLMSNVEDKSFYFISGYGASLMVDSQKTLDGFNVSKIDKDHPSWDQGLSDHGEMLGAMLDEIVELDQANLNRMVSDVQKEI